MRKSEKEWRTCCCNITADLSDFTPAMEERHQNRIFVGLHERHKPVRGHRTRRPGYISPPAGHHTQFSHATERRGREKRSKREKEKRDTSVSNREEEKEKKRSKRKGRGEERR